MNQETVKEYFKYHGSGRLILLKTFSPYVSKRFVGCFVGYTDGGERTTTINGKQWKLKTLIYLYHHNELPKFGITRKDGDKLNDRIENLIPYEPKHLTGE